MKKDIRCKLNKVISLLAVVILLVSHVYGYAGTVWAASSDAAYAEEPDEAASEVLTAGSSSAAKGAAAAASDEVQSSGQGNASAEDGTVQPAEETAENEAAADSSSEVYETPDEDTGSASVEEGVEEYETPDAEDAASSEDAAENAEAAEAADGETEILSEEALTEETSEADSALQGDLSYMHAGGGRSMRKAAAKAELQIDKSATPLNKDYQSTVTLTLPGKQENNSYDVVFVVDKSASTGSDIAESIKDYVETVNHNSADIKVGVVLFYSKAMVAKPLDREAVTDAAFGYSGSGTNLSGGILLGTAMLDADTEVPADHKYLIVLSDGDTHVFNKDNAIDLNADGTPALGEDHYSRGSKKWNYDHVSTSDVMVVLDSDRQAGPAAYQRKYGSYNPPEDWSVYLDAVSELVENDGDQFQYPWLTDKNN